MALPPCCPPTPPQPATFTPTTTLLPNGSLTAGSKVGHQETPKDIFNNQRVMEISLGNNSVFSSCVQEGDVKHFPGSGEGKKLE